MNYPMIDYENAMQDDPESRRRYERYNCKGITARISASARQYLKPVDKVEYSAIISDISLDGLAIQYEESVTIGELLRIEIINPNEKLSECIMAEVKWFKLTEQRVYLIGLKVISKDGLAFLSDRAEEEERVSELTCSHCGEASFYCEENKNESSSAITHSCCRCGHSHHITEVIAFNRK